VKFKYPIYDSATEKFPLKAGKVASLNMRDDNALLIVYTTRQVPLQLLL